MLSMDQIRVLKRFPTADGETEGRILTEHQMYATVLPAPWGVPGAVPNKQSDVELPVRESIFSDEFESVLANHNRFNLVAHRGGLVAFCSSSEQADYYLHIGDLSQGGECPQFRNIRSLQLTSVPARIVINHDGSSIAVLCARPSREVAARLESLSDVNVAASGTRDHVHIIHCRQRLSFLLLIGDSMHVFYVAEDGKWVEGTGDSFNVCERVYACQESFFAAFVTTPTSRPWDNLFTVALRMWDRTGMFSLISIYCRCVS